MISIMWKRIILWTGVSGVLLGTFGFWLAWRHLTERLNSPQFRRNLERSLSRALNGKMVFDELNCHVGIHPWIVLGNIRFTGENEDFQGTAKEFRVGVRILPLWHRQVVFSHMELNSPHLRFRLPKDGSLPQVPLLKSEPDVAQEGFKFHVENLSIKKAVVDLVDESRPGSPSLQIQADFKIASPHLEGGAELDVRGNLGGKRGSGDFSLEGRLGDNPDLRVSIPRLPLALLADYVPAFAPWQGILGVSGTWGGPAHDRRWTINGNLKDLQPASSQAEWPLTAECALLSNSTSTVRLKWNSPSSSVVANVLIPSLKRPEMIVHVQGEKIVAKEFSEILTALQSPSSGPPSGRGRWTIKARAEIENLAGEGWSVQNLRLQGEADPAAGRLSHLGFTMYQGTVTAQSRWRFSKTPTPGWTLTTTVEAKNLQLSEMGKKGPIPWRGLLSGKVNVIELPLGPRESDGRQKTLINGFMDRSSSWEMDVQISSADGKGGPITDLAGHFSHEKGLLKIKRVEGRTAGGTLSLHGEINGERENGPYPFKLVGQFKDIETKGIAAAISTNAYLLNGQFSGGVNLSGTLHPWNTQELNGRFNFIGRQGLFRTAPSVLSVFSALKINSLLQRVGGEKETGLPFQVLESSGAIEAGRFILKEPLLLKNQSFQMAYTGWMEVRFGSGAGTLLFNFLESSSHLVQSIPVVSSLILGPNGELVPLVVDVVIEKGKVDVTPRSIKTLTGPLVNVVKNAFRLPFQIFSPKKSKTD